MQNNKSIVILVAFLLTIANVSADITQYTEVVFGPVKHLTVTSNQYGSIYVWEYWYDRDGRLEEFVHFIDGRISSAYVRQYTDSNYIDLKYDGSGLIEGSYNRTTIDSLGRPLCTWRYEKGIPLLIDSCVYGDRLKEMEHYHYDYQKEAIALQYTCEYDSINRLIRKYYNFSGNEVTCIYEYRFDGSYLETRTDKDGKIIKTEQIFNKKGQLVKVKGTDGVDKFQKFDKYGNWTIWDIDLDIPIGSFHYTFTRTFEYYE